MNLQSGSLEKMSEEKLKEIVEGIDDDLPFLYEFLAKALNRSVNFLCPEDVNVFNFKIDREGRHCLYQLERLDGNFLEECNKTITGYGSGSRPSETVLDILQDIIPASRYHGLPYDREMDVLIDRIMKYARIEESHPGTSVGFDFILRPRLVIRKMWKVVGKIGSFLSTFIDDYHIWYNI